MHKTILCKHIKPKHCETEYGKYCTITKLGASKGDCKKIVKGPMLTGVNPEHVKPEYLIRMDFSTSVSSNSSPEFNYVYGHRKSFEETSETSEAEERQQLEHSKNNSCVNMPFYNNIDSSCYMDSVIFSLFAFPNDFVHNYLINVTQQYIAEHTIDKITEEVQDQDQDQKILATIEYVTRINQILKKIDKDFKSKKRAPNLNSINHAGSNSLRIELLKNPISNDHFGNGTQEDASEFLEALFRTFFIETLTITETITYKSSKHLNQTKKPRTRTETTYPVYNISLDDVSVPLADVSVPLILSKTVEEKLRADSFIHGDVLPGNNKAANGSELNANGHPNVFDTITTNTEFKVSRAPEDQFMILSLKRFETQSTDGSHKVLVKDIRPIKPPQHIKLNKDSAELQLNNIIVHLGDTIGGGHYVAYFKCKDNWYLYNDSDVRIQRVGTYEQLLNHRIKHYKGTVQNNAYILFYGINNPTI